MHDKRRPSGTFPGNGSESPDKLLLSLRLLFIASSSVVVEVPSKRGGICLSTNLPLLKAHPVRWRSALFMHNEFKTREETVQLPGPAKMKH